MADQDIHQPLQQQAEIAARAERRAIISAEIEKIQKCDGSDPTLVRQWIQEIQLARGLPDNAAAVELISSSTSGAFKLELEAYLQQQDNRNDTPWQAIRTHLLQCFVSADHQEFHRGLLAKVKQQPNENILAYNRRFRQAALEAFPGDRNVDQSRELVRLYGKGLLEPAAARKLVAEGWPATLENAFTRMTDRETAQERYSHLGRREEPMELAAYATRQPLEQPKKTDLDLVQRKLDQLMTKLAKMELQKSSVQPTMQYPQTPQTTYSTEQGTPPRMDAQLPHSRPPPRCYNCQKLGHIARRCPNRRLTPQSNSRADVNQPKN